MKTRRLIVLIAESRRQELADNHALRGIAIKLCAKTNQPFWDEGHAHIDADPYYGWICFSDYRYTHATNLCHELAHVISNTRGHGERWKKAVRDLGGRVERKYRTKPLVHKVGER